MVDFNNMRYGISRDGINSILKECDVTEILNVVSDISDIEAVCHNNWDGRSKDHFLKCLGEDVRRVDYAILEAYRTLSDELIAIAQAIVDFDDKLMIDEQ